MSITVIPNQPLNFIPVGGTPHNQRSQNCNCLGQKYFQQVQCDDISRAQVTLETVGGELLSDPNFDNPLVAGITDGTSGDDIVDSTADFLNDGVADDQIVTNETDSTYGWVDTGLGAITATFIPYQKITTGFVSGEDYSVWNWKRDTSVGGAWAGNNFMRIDGGLLKKVGQVNDVGVYTEFALQTGVLYQISFTVQNMAKPAPLAGISIDFGGATAVSVNADGVYNFYYFAETAVNNRLLIKSFAAAEFEITTMSIKAMNSPILQVQDLDENIVFTGDEDNITYTSIQDIDGISQQNSPAALVVMDWSDLVVGYACNEGCYKVCVLDRPSIEYITNGVFTGGSNWTLGSPTSWAFQDGVLDGNAAGPPSPLASRVASQTLSNTLQSGKKYTLSLEVNTHVAGDVEAWLGNAGSGILLGTFGSNGTHTAEIDLTGEVDQTKFELLLSDSSGWLKVDNVSILEVVEDAEVVACSEPFDLRISHDCSILLEWSNNSDAFGMNYTEFALSHSLRVDAKKWQPIFEKRNKQTDIDSVGKAEVIASKTVQVDRFTVREQPEYIHKALAIGLEHNNFTIDSVKYITEDEEYAPAWRKSSLLAPVDIAMIKSGQDLQNRNC